MGLKNIINTLIKTNNIIIRRVDEIGRVIIPIEFRKGSIKENTKVYLYEIEDYLILSHTNKEGKGLEKNINEIGMISIDFEIRNRLNWIEKDKIIIGRYKDYVILKKLNNN